MFLTHYESVICKVKKANQLLVLFGAGEFGNLIYNYLKEAEIKVDYFCDNDYLKWGQYLYGLKVVSPNELSAISDRVNLLITSAFYDEIENQLTTKGFNNIYYLPLIFSQKYSREDIKIADNKIDELMGFLEDDKSKQIIKKLIECRLTNNFIPMGSVADNACLQYFDPDIIKLTGEEVFVDGGAYSGDTINSLLSTTKGCFKMIHGFEPDEKTYHKLVDNLSRINDFNKIKLNQKGLYNKNTKIGFAFTNNMGSRIDERLENNIKVVSLDQYLAKSEDVSFIKMDIEGAEKEAILGAKRVILKFKPKLAISIYHKPEDLWEIPLLIKSINPHYQIYIRHYSPGNLETVCYGINREY